MKTNSQIRKEACQSLKGHWGMAILSVIIYGVIAGGTSAGASSSSLFPMMMSPMVKTALAICGLWSLLVVIPLNVGYENAFKLLIENGDENIPGNMFRLGFKNYWHNIWGQVAMAIKIFLWCLLFIIPGIVMSFAYSMTPYILKDNPELSGWEASSRSREMMRGHKGDLFLMALGFCGYLILGIFTLFIAWFWIIPWMHASFAAFYQSIKEEN